MLMWMVRGKLIGGVSSCRFVNTYVCIVVVSMYSNVQVICYIVFLSRHFKLRPASWSSGQSLLTVNHEIPGSIPGSTVGIFPGGEDSHSDHGLDRLVEFRFKGPPGTTSSYITTHIIGTT